MLSASSPCGSENFCPVQTFELSTTTRGRCHEWRFWYRSSRSSWISSTSVLLVAVAISAKICASRYGFSISISIGSFAVEFPILFMEILVTTMRFLKNKEIYNDFLSTLSSLGSALSSLIKFVTGSCWFVDFCKICCFISSMPL